MDSKSNSSKLLLRTAERRSLGLSELRIYDKMNARCKLGVVSKNDGGGNRTVRCLVDDEWQTPPNSMPHNSIVLL